MKAQAKSPQIAIGIMLARLYEALGRIPTTRELQQEFRCSRATAYRYQAALRQHHQPTGCTA